MCVTSVLESQIPVLFTLWPAVFEWQTILRQMHEWLKWPWNTTRSYIPYICVTSVLLVSPICVTSVPDSQISVRVILRPVIFEIQAILRPVQNDTKMTLNPTSSNVCTICITSIPGSQISLRFAVWQAIFEMHAQAILRRAPNDPKMILNTTRSKVQCIHRTCVTNVPRRDISNIMSQFHLIFLYDQLFSRYKVASWKCSKWPQNDLKYLTVKSTRYTLNIYPRDPNYFTVLLYDELFPRICSSKSEI